MGDRLPVPKLIDYFFSVSGDQTAHRNPPPASNVTRKFPMAQVEWVRAVTAHNQAPRRDYLVPPQFIARPQVCLLLAS